MVLNPKLIETLIPVHEQNETNWPVEKVLMEAVKAGTVAKPYKLHHPYTETKTQVATTTTASMSSVKAGVPSEVAS